MLGKNPQEIFGEDDAFLFSPEDARKVMETDRRVMVEGEPLIYEETLTFCGSPKILSISKVPYRNENGEMIGIITLAQDITERKHAQELGKAKEAAEIASKAKSDFLSQMSHEMRTPLNVVIGFCDLLMETSLNDLQKEYADTCRQSAKLLSYLINDILDRSKIEAKKINLTAVDFDLVKLVNVVFKIVSQCNREKDVSLHFEFDQDVPKRLTGDPTRIQQILLNLVGNAVKFTPQGEVRLHVRRQPSAVISLEEDTVPLELSVKDTGIGIPLDQQEEIFEPLNQGDPSIAEEYGGTGLGLTITKVLVEAMGGRISVNSEAGKGSEFVVMLPLRESVSSDGRPGNNRLTDGTAPSAERAAVSFQGLRVLVAEDNRVIRKLMNRMLGKLGCEVDFAANGQEAVDMVKTNAYGIVFMDLKMPVLDGIDAARIIRLDLKIDIPIITLTAATGQEDRELSLASDMDDFLPKPIDMARLRDLMARWVEIYRQKKAKTE